MISSYLQHASPMKMGTIRAGWQPPRAYSKGLYCFQPKGSPTAWISGDAKASHYVPGQSQRWRPCQRPSQRVAFSLIGGPLMAPAGAVRGIRFCFPPTSWRALLDARLFRWFPVLLIFGFQRAERGCRGVSLSLLSRKTSGVDKTFQENIFLYSFSSNLSRR